MLAVAARVVHLPARLLAAQAVLAVVAMVEVKQIRQPLKTELLIQAAAVAAVGLTPQDMLLALAAPVS
jgi:hypothetical protein